MNIDTTQLQEAVVNQAVAALVDQFSDPSHEITTLIHARAEKLIEDRVSKAIDEEIGRIIGDGLEKLIFQATNNHGEKKWPDRTLREFIADMTKAVFTEYLDPNDKPTTDSWYKKPENQRINRLISKAIGPAIQDSVTAATKQIQGAIHAHVSEFVKTQLNEAASRLAR